MPRIRRADVPPGLLRHLLDRIRTRVITEEQLGLFNDWVLTDPEIPEGKWFRRFPGLIACGEGKLVKAFLRAGQVATGKEVL